MAEIKGESQPKTERELFVEQIEKMFEQFVEDLERLKKYFGEVLEYGNLLRSIHQPEDIDRIEGIYPEMMWQI